MTYWPYLTANHLEEGACFLDFLWDRLPQAQAFARDFYDAPGACFPGAMALDGTTVGGWAQYSYSPTNSAWLVQSFHAHWRYTMDRVFLSQRAYPFGLAVAECIESILQEDEDGMLVLPLSSSPEIYNNTLAAWLRPNSNHDLALLRWLFGAMAEMADALDQSQDAHRWRGILQRLHHLAVAEVDGRPVGPLMIDRAQGLFESHRHHAHLMGIFPLGILNVEMGSDVEEIIRNSIYQIDALGTPGWIGFGFSWMACIAARVAQPERALTMLELFVKGFVLRNGFHVNGDYKELGLSSFHYRPFTLESSFAAAQAVNEMLLQSWGGVVRIFPAVPAAWDTLAFDNLRAEGAFLVSARRQESKTTHIQIQAQVDGQLRLRDPFAGSRVHWSKRGVKRSGSDFQCYLRAGEVLQGQARQA